MTRLQAISHFDRTLRALGMTDRPRIAVAWLVTAGWLALLFLAALVLHLGSVWV